MRAPASRCISNLNWQGRTFGGGQSFFCARGIPRFKPNIKDQRQGRHQETITAVLAEGRFCLAGRASPRFKHKLTHTDRASRCARARIERPPIHTHVSSVILFRCTIRAPYPSYTRIELRPVPVHESSSLHFTHTYRASSSSRARIEFPTLHTNVSSFALFPLRLDLPTLYTHVSSFVLFACTNGAPTTSHTRIEHRAAPVHESNSRSQAP